MTCRYNTAHRSSEQVADPDLPTRSRRDLADSAHAHELAARAAVLVDVALRIVAATRRQAAQSNKGEQRGRYDVTHATTLRARRSLVTPRLRQHGSSSPERAGGQRSTGLRQVGQLAGVGAR